MGGGTQNNKSGCIVINNHTSAEIKVLMSKTDGSTKERDIAANEAGVFFTDAVEELKIKSSQEAAVKQ